MPKPDLITRQAVQPQKLQRARELRHAMTEAESVLWQALRANRLDGWHFRRQQVIQGFIVDFYCNPACLVIEVDGLIHQEQMEADARREDALRALGLRVLRLGNEEIVNNLPGSLARIRQALADGDRQTQEGDFV